MEAALFFLDCLVLLWLCICVIRAEREGNPDRLGLFRYEEERTLGEQKPPVKKS